VVKLLMKLEVKFVRFLVLLEKIKPSAQSGECVLWCIVVELFRRYI
jgi:hypothetical protein